MNKKLANSQKRVVLNGVTSICEPVSNGVPQGSVLGPVIFPIYVNDIDNGVSSFISEFTDDTKIGNSVINESNTQNLQEQFDKIQEWLAKWQVPFNGASAKYYK